MVDELQHLLEEQLTYYRARAPEYDQWALRKGHFARGSKVQQRWFSEVGKLEEALERFRPSGRVLELACGTGQWTERLLRYTDDLTAVDAAPEVLQINRQRVGDRVRHVKADLFSWEPDRPYDVVFFSFWLSHVPPERFRRFWHVVAQALAPGGRVFFIDNLASETAARVDPEHPGPDERSVLRRLSDGRVFRVWKVLHHPGQLNRQLREIGWEAKVEATGDFFLHGEALYRAQA